MQHRPVAEQALDILVKVAHSGASLTKDAIKTQFGASERVARVVHRVLRGKLDIDVVRAEARGDSPRGAVGSTLASDRVDAEAPSEGGKYEVLPDGRYLFTWEDASGPRSIYLTEEKLRSMVRAYVDRHQGGEGQSMQEVAIRHDLTRRDFWKIKSIYGLTKQHEPFTTKEIAETPLDSLADQQLALKRRALLTRVETEDYAQTRRLAAKWLALEAGTLDPLREVLAEVVGHVPPASPDVPWAAEESPSLSRYITLYQGSDLHYGLAVDDRYSIGNTTYNRAVARQRFLKGLTETVEHGVRAFGAPPEYVLLLVGGDISHVDNVHGATSSMKHTQDMDGIPDTLPREITALYLEAIDSLLTRGLRVYVACVPGNHDEMMSRQMFSAIWAAYRHDRRVLWGNDTSSHAFVRFGQTAIVAHHGHGEREASDLGATLEGWLHETRQQARHRYAVTGNLHHLKMHEDNGCILLQQPSPAASDRYHTREGYDKARPATIGAYFSDTEGLLGVRYIGF